MHIGVLATPDNFHTKKWTTALRAAGAQVTVFSLLPEQLPQVPCVQVAPRFTRQHGISYLSYLSTGRRLREALQAHNIDLVNPIDMTPYGVWARRAGVGPILGIAMGADILEYPPARSAEQVPAERLWSRGHAGPATLAERLSYPLRQGMFRREVAKALAVADFLIADNWVLVRAMRDWFGVPAEKTALNRWGVEPELFQMTETEARHLREKYRIAAGQRLLLSPRGIKPIYQGDVILAAFRQLLAQGLPDTRLLMLSAGYAVPPDLDREARELEARYPQFTLIREAIPREEMCQLWNLTDVFVSAPVYDGYSNALSEGRYIGAVPIVNDTPATREVMRHGEHGYVVAPFTPERLAAATTEILQDLPGWKARVVVVNRRWVEQEALLSVNIQRFLEKAESLVRARHGKGKFSL